MFVLRVTEDFRQLWELDGVLILVHSGNERALRVEQLETEGIDAVYYELR